MTLDDKARFLDACPHLLDDVQAIDKALAGPATDWPATWDEIESAAQEARAAAGRRPSRSSLRSVFTLRDEGEPVPADMGRGAGFEADADLRDFENVPLKEDVDAYFEREVMPHVPDAWMDRSKDKVGYEINFNRHFYVFTPPRSLAEIDRT